MTEWDVIDVDIDVACEDRHDEPEQLCFEEE